MSILLNVRAEDRDAELILSYVRTQFSLMPTDEQIGIMERALKWLRAADENAFNVDPDALNEIEISFPANFPAS